MDADKLEPAEVARLYETHGVELQRLLMSVLRNPDLVAETLQTALVRALEQGHTSHGESRKGWLFRVAMNEALLVKRRQRREWTAMDRMSALVAEGWLQAETPEAAASRAESAERVREALQRLPDDQRHVVELRIHHGMTFAAIATELATPLGTVLTRMRLAVKRLSELLKDPRADD